MKKWPGLIVTAIGFLIVVSNIIVLLFYYYPDLLPGVVFNLGVIFGVYPSEALIFLPLGKIGLANLLLTCLYMICGLGLLLISKIFRIITIVLTILRILTFVGLRLVFFKIVMGSPWQMGDILPAIISIVVPVVYLVFLFHPQVKLLFKEFKPPLKQRAKKVGILLLVLLFLSGLTVPMAMRPLVYDNEDFGVSMMVPRTWEIAAQNMQPQKQPLSDESGYQETATLVIFVKKHQDIETSPMIMLQAGRYFKEDGSQEVVENPFTNDDDANMYVDILKGAMDFKIIDEPRFILLDKRGAVRFIADFDEDRVVYLATANDNTSFILQCMAIAGDEFDENKAVFEKVIKSIRFKK